MKLVIVESPSKAKTIEKYLGDNYTVLSSIGHICELPKSESKAINIENDFKPCYEVIKGKEKIIFQLKESVKKAEIVYLATDPDREGEAIAWHLKEILNIKTPKRIVFNEITKEKVEDAIKNPREIDDNLKIAQEARRVLDRLFGYTLSALIWKKVRYGLSAGRVQSPALRILMEREREREKFKSTPFWIIQGKIRNKDGKIFEVSGVGEFLKYGDAKTVLDIGVPSWWIVGEIKKTKRSRKAKQPFITSTLQQQSNSRLSYSPANTMRIAQKLYEEGFITYMRTDSTRMSDLAHESIKLVIENSFGKDLYEKKEHTDKKKNIQDAHEAIRPTDMTKITAGRNEEEKKIYQLIWKRTIASQMVDAESLTTNIKLNPKVIKNENIILVLKGSQITKMGWLEVDQDSCDSENILPEIQKFDEFECIELNQIDKHTEPPNRYSEAGLVKELEKRGIGRPSTYAATIKTLTDRMYVEKKDRTLIPTDTGNVVSSFVEKYFKEYIADIFTANMEDDLDKIAIGEKKYKDILTKFYYPFFDSVDKKKDIEKLTTLGKAPSNFRCPICNSGMNIKLSKIGTFMSCGRFPDCNGARTKEGEEIKEEKIGKICPQCKKGDLIKKMGRFGVFCACNNYPKCKYIEQDKETKESAKTGIECPVCKKAEIIERKGKFGAFYGCNAYPGCKFTMRAKPTSKKCSICNSLMMEGTKTIPERCCDKTCPMHRPDKLTKMKR